MRKIHALTAVAVACLTIYDMVKAVEREMHIEGVRLIEKRGGKSGHYRAIDAQDIAALKSNLFGMSVMTYSVVQIMIRSLLSLIATAATFAALHRTPLPTRHARRVDYDDLQACSDPPTTARWSHPPQ